MLSVAATHHTDVMSSLSLSPAFSALSALVATLSLSVLAALDALAVLRILLPGKMDPLNVSNFVRRIASARICKLDTFFSTESTGSAGAGGSSEAVVGGGGGGRGEGGEGGEGGGEKDIYFLEIRGTAFLYHQVRCICAILFMVGRHLEEPSVVDALLDVQANPCRPT